MDFVRSTLKALNSIYEVLSKKREDELYEKKEIGAGGDISTGVDLFAESIFIENLIDFGEIRSEECGIVGKGENIIYIDPIDGSANFLSNFPYYGASVALCDSDEKPLVGIVCNFANGDVFIKDKQGFRKGKLGCDSYSAVELNSYSKIGLFEKAYANCEIAMELAINRVKFRSPGALALSLAYAHEVDFLLFSGEARDYDVKAGLFMCEDFYREINERYILVSKTKESFEYIKNMIRGKHGIH